MDDIFFAYLCDPNHRTTRMKFGEDPDELIEKYAWMLNEAIKDRPKDMTVGMHLCRGNFKSNFAAQGAYDPTVDAVFNKIDLDVYFMEYDDERSGGLEPLKYLPKGNKRVMPGFITTKQGKLETLDFLKKKFEEASKYISIDQLGIAPQCGFSSKASQILIACGKPFSFVDILSNPEIRANLPEYSSWPTFPQLFVKGELVGGSDILSELHENGELQKIIDEVVIEE